MKIATWNINSVRLRIDNVLRLLREEDLDILCLQETKCPTGQFPSAAFHGAGYHHICEKGQVGYHGVAIVSRIAFDDADSRQFCGKDDARHCSIKISSRDLTVHNFYVPAGGDEPDPVVNEKFSHKLSFLDEMSDWCKSNREGVGSSILVGDLNVAPLENDVWSHKQLARVVSHTQIEIEKLEAAQRSGDWLDCVRKLVPPDRKVYTWWSYRAKDWAASDRGRRLDHIWTRGLIQSKLSEIVVRKDCRGWAKASDHVPVIAKFSI